MQHFGNDLFEERAKMNRQRYTIFAYHLKICLHFQALVASLTHQHFVQNNSQCPNITLLRIEIVHVCFRSHILGRAYVIIHLRLVRNLIHFAISEVNNGYSFAYLRFCFKEDIVWLEVAMYHSFVPNLLVSLEELPKNKHCFIFRQAICCPFEVLGQRSALKKFSDQIYIVFLDDYIKQSNDIVMSSILYLAQIAQSSYLTAQQISSNFIINFLKVDCLDGHFHLGRIEQKAQVNITS